MARRYTLQKGVTPVDVSVAAGRRTAAAASNRECGYIRRLLLLDASGLLFLLKLFVVSRVREGAMTREREREKELYKNTRPTRVGRQTAYLHTQ